MSNQKPANNETSSHWAETENDKSRALLHAHHLSLVTYDELQSARVIYAAYSAAVREYNVIREKVGYDTERGRVNNAALSAVRRALIDDSSNNKIIADSYA